MTIDAQKFLKQSITLAVRQSLKSAALPEPSQPGEASPLTENLEHIVLEEVSRTVTANERSPNAPQTVPLQYREILNAAYAKVMQNVGAALIALAEAAIPLQSKTVNTIATPKPIEQGLAYIAGLKSIDIQDSRASKAPMSARPFVDAKALPSSPRLIDAQGSIKTITEWIIEMGGSVSTADRIRLEDALWFVDRLGKEKSDIEWLGKEEIFSIEDIAFAILDAFHFATDLQPKAYWVDEAYRNPEANISVDVKRSCQQTHHSSTIDFENGRYSMERQFETTGLRISAPAGHIVTISYTPHSESGEPEPVFKSYVLPQEGTIDIAWAESAISYVQCAITPAPVWGQAELPPPIDAFTLQFPPIEQNTDSRVMTFQ